MCDIHRYHWPRNLTDDDHHIIPQAWQHHDGSTRLWDPRTVRLCPTGHRNVHHWIVALMKAGRGAELPHVAELALFAGKRLTREQSIALRALERYVQSGRSLKALYDARLLGFA